MTCECKSLEELPIRPDEYLWCPFYRCRQCGKLYTCSCFEEPLLKFYEKETLEESHKGDPFIKENIQILKERYKKILTLSYKDNICHQCLKTPARIKIKIGKYYPPFQQFYYPYIEKRAVELDIPPFNNYDFETLKERNRIYRIAENDIREYFGYHKIGEKWFNETHLYKILLDIFKGYEVIREASPVWLKPQRLDVFIPELNLACEYQGKQHFASIKHFGGESSLQANRERDAIKLDKCTKNGVKLVYFYYWEEICHELVIKKLSKYV